MDEQQQRLTVKRHFRLLTFGGLIGLALGLTAGTIAYLSQNPSLISFSSIVEPVGVLWTNALRMTVIPLVISNLIVGIASVPNLRTVGRLGGLALMIFLSLLTLGAIFTLLIAPPIVGRLSLSSPLAGPASTGTNDAVAKTGEETVNVPPFTQLVTDLVPTNPFRAASEGAILPLMIFTICFALAITRLQSDRYNLLITFFKAVGDAMLILIGWIFWFAPLGVFALTFSFAVRTGPSVIGVLGYFVLLVCTLLLAFTLVLYAIVAILGGVPIRRFAHAVAPAQFVAISTRSSLTSLPALIVGAEQRLKLPSAITGFVLPLSVSTFKVNRTISSIVKLLFLTRFYDVALTPMQMTLFILMVIMLSFSSPGVPSGGGVRTIPAYLALGIPIEGVLMFDAVEVIPDIFKTLVNVTGDMTTAVIVSRIAGLPANLPHSLTDAAREDAKNLQANPEVSLG